MQNFLDGFMKFAEGTGIALLINPDTYIWWQTILMIAIACVLLYLAIVKKFEPLLLVPIAFGMLLANLPQTANIMHPEWFSNPEFFVNGHIDFGKVLNEGGLLDLLYLGVKLGIYPPLIFLGIGAMTDFGPLIANPKSILLGAAAQIGVFFTFLGALFIGDMGWANFGFMEAASIGIIGGADGPTAIYVTKTLAPTLLPAIAIAAYSYMALVPIIQPPIMKALTTKKERSVVMEQLRPVSKREKILFPIIVTIVVGLIVPDAIPLVGMLMLGNLFKESGVVDRISKTAQTFLTAETLMIVVLGLIAFSISTAGGVLFGKLMYIFTGGKVNPLIGSAGVSAVPMAARVSQTVGQKENPSNFLLMHAMGPNVAGVIGSAVAAGVFLAMYAG